MQKFARSWPEHDFDEELSLFFRGAKNFGFRPENPFFAMGTPDLGNGLLVALCKTVYLALWV